MPGTGGFLPTHQSCGFCPQTPDGFVFLLLHPGATGPQCSHVSCAVCTLETLARGHLKCLVPDLAMGQTASLISEHRGWSCLEMTRQTDSFPCHQKPHSQDMATAVLDHCGKTPLSSALKKLRPGPCGDPCGGYLEVHFTVGFRPRLPGES